MERLIYKIAGADAAKDVTLMQNLAAEGKYEITDEMSLRNAIRDYIRFYRDERPQSRYNCKTPTEVRTEALSSAVPQAYPIAKNKRIGKFKAKWCA